MKNTIKDAIKKSLDKTIENNNISIDIIEINICKDKKFGDFSSNIAMKLASKFNYKPKEFANFIEAFSWMTKVAIWAEKLNHHPEWSNVYKKVEVFLTTHDCGGISDLDLQMAKKMDLFIG